MAMLHMQRILIYALQKDRKPILELLQRRGVIEINDAIEEDNIFRKSDVSNSRMGFEKNIALAREAADILNRYVPEKKSMLSSLNGRKAVSPGEYASFTEKYEKTVNAAGNIIAYSKEIAEQKAEILKLNSQAEMLYPWTKLDIPLSFSGTKYTKSFIGSLPKEYTLEDIYAKLAEYMPFDVEIISSTKEQTCIFVVCTGSNAEGVYDILRSMDFSHISLTSDKVPSEQMETVDRQIKEAEETILKAEKAIINLADIRNDLLFLQDYDRMRSDKYEVIGRLLQSPKVFILTGYIPECEEKKVEEALNANFCVAIEFEEPASGEDVPVILKNNGFSRPLESVVEGYSLPGEGETDPTMVMSLFYYVIFGIIMADAGYGALIIAVCIYCLVKYGKTMELPSRNFIMMFFYCGISTLFWGIMFGSFFGDIIDVVAGTFLGVKNLPIIPPLWFVPVNKPMQMLTFSMAIGIIHLLTGLAMKFYQSLLQKDYKSILYDSVSWMILIISCTVLLMSMEMITNILGISIKIPAPAVKASEIAAIASSIVIVLTNGRESRNPFKRFLKGAYALYGISGYLSDVLSYSRLLALGLASSVIGSVVNKMAGMAGSIGVFGIIIFFIIVILGHVLNFAINIIGAYVHTNRLQYVEFFGKFYGGGGRSFNPFHMSTKYYKVKER